jgi:hypothetical protein
VSLVDLLAREWNVLLCAAVWILMVTIERLLPWHFEKGRLMNRAEPLIPLSICVFCSVFVPGPWMPDDVNDAQRLILGVILGALAYNGGAMLKRSGVTPFLLHVGKKQ